MLPDYVVPVHYDLKVTLELKAAFGRVTITKRTKQPHATDRLIHHEPCLASNGLFKYVDISRYVHPSILDE